jgi:hypothetical protein
LTLYYHIIYDASNLESPISSGARMYFRKQTPVTVKAAPAGLGAVVKAAPAGLGAAFNAVNINLNAAPSDGSAAAAAAALRARGSAAAAQRTAAVAAAAGARQAPAPRPQGPASWQTLDNVFPPQLAKNQLLQETELFYTLNFVGGSKSWLTDQAAQHPILLALMVTVNKILGLNNPSPQRSVLMLRAMAEYAENTKVPADQQDVFSLVKGIVWKYEIPYARWSPFVKKAKTAEISQVAAAVAQGKFKDFKRLYTAFVSANSPWFGNFLDLYGATASHNEKLLATTNTVTTAGAPKGPFSGKSGFFWPIVRGQRFVTTMVKAPTRAYPEPVQTSVPVLFTGSRSAHFAALTAAVNKTLGLAPAIKFIGSATSDVLKALRYLQISAPSSNIGKFVTASFDWTNSRYKNLRSEDTIRIASQVASVGGPAKAGDAILALTNQSFVPPTTTSQAATTDKVAAVVKTSAEPKGPFWWEQAASTAKTAPVSSSAAGRIRIAAASKGVSASLVSKITARQTSALGRKLRNQLVVKTATLINLQKVQQTALANAQAAAAAAPTDPAAQAAVETAQAAVIETTAQVQATEQAIAQVDTAVAVANTAADAAAVPAATDEAVAQAAAAAAAAASAATEAAADVLPADVVAQAATEATDEVAADAAASDDPATVKAAEAATDSGIIKDAVVEGTALAVEAKQAAGGSTLALLLGGAALLFLITRK